jgi:hypothetical protein
VSAETTLATHRAAQALRAASGVTFPWALSASGKMLAAALNGPKDQYDCMDDVTIAVHAAICEDSPEDCVEWRGACVKAVEAAREAILGADS